MTKTKIPKLSALIATKKFDWVNSYITDTLFPTPKTISADFKLFHFNKYISSEDAVKEMEKEGYIPATAWELLSWKGWNGTDWVVALGSVGWVSGDRGVPYLYGGDSGRSLYLSWRGRGWGADYRFLGVRNSDLKTSAPQNDTVTLGHFECPNCKHKISFS